MVGKMKLRTLLAASAIALSSQASFAATDTSCNPFARGSSCNGAISAGKSIGQYSFGKRASLSRPHKSKGFRLKDRGARGEERYNGTLNSLAALFAALGLDKEINLAALDLEEETNFDGPEVIVVSETDDTAVPETDAVAAVPVPASAALLLAGLGGLVAMRRKKS